MSHALTLRLRDQDFRRLDSRARKAGLEPVTLAQEILHEALGSNERDPLAVLAELTRLRQGQAEADTLTALRRARHDLEGRSGV